MSKTIVGLALFVIGVSSFLTFYASVRRTDTVIDISLKLQPGEKYEPYMNGTYHHTRVISKSALAGEVIVKEGSISFTANGFNTENNKDVIVSQRYSFLINPADDLYTFSFVNTEDKVLSSIRFILKEIWIDFFRLIPAFISLLITVPTGIVLVILDKHKKSKGKPSPQSRLTRISIAVKSTTDNTAHSPPIFSFHS